MTIKKWRPLWSYDVEKTERWLSEMAAEGQHLTAMNRLTRIFTFASGDAEEANYQVVYDKSESVLPKGLENAGWEVAASDQRWKFVKNSLADIKAFPSPENRLRRNRVHQNVLSWMTKLSLFIAFFLLIVGPPGGELNIHWLIGAILIGLMIFTIVLFIYVSDKVNVAEKQLYGEEYAHIDLAEPLGETFVKWRIGWMDAPDRLGKWLTKMAAQGHVLVQIKGFKFIFEKGQPRQIAYILDYHWTTSPAYFDMHKGAGWQLKLTNGLRFMKYSLWAQSYNKGDKPPQFTNSNQGNKMRARKLLEAAALDLLFVGAWVVVILVANYSSFQAGNLASFEKLMLLIFAICVVPLVIGAMRLLTSAVRMRKV
ncbi:DUF2812 domain-containing protein [Sporosarcina sp. FSL K6-2383]|uniref:DUF2812 domain-containing protein n=1 Tax=Sporosarcina sp. FSL K6-2383 TaxID=2921556 RepID=UPI00315B3002